MYRKAMLGLLMVLLAVIAAELAHPQAAPTQLPEPKPSTASLDLLDRKIPALIVHNSTLEQAIQALQSKTDVPIVVDWDWLKDWKNLPVDVDFHDITLGDAVAYLFSFRRNEGLSEIDADFDIVDGKLVVTWSESLPPWNFIQRTYDVRDLLADEYWGCPPGTLTDDIRDERRGSLCELLESSSGIENWIHEARGGSIGGHRKSGLGRYDEWAGRLSVLQTAYNQRIVESILERLRVGNSSLVARAPMQRYIDHLDFHSTPLREAIHTIVEKAHASVAFESRSSIYVAPRDTSELQTELEKPVTVTLENVTFETALTAIMQFSDVTMDEYEGGVIVVSNALPPNPLNQRQPGVMEAIDASDLVKATGETPRRAVRGGWDAEREKDTKGGKAIRDMIEPFSGPMAFFGTRIIVRGSARRAQQVIDCLAHSVRFDSMSIEDGVIFLDGSGGGIMRAYDVSPLIKSGQWYHEDNPGDDPNSLDERKGHALADFIAIDDRQTAVYWHGRILAMTPTPGGQRRIFNELRSVLLTGRLPKRPKE